MICNVCLLLVMIASDMVINWYSCVNKYVAGEYADEKEVLENFMEMCEQ